MAVKKPPTVAATLRMTAAFRTLPPILKFSILSSCVKVIVPAAAQVYPVTAVHLALLNANMCGIVLRSEEPDNWGQHDYAH